MHDHDHDGGGLTRGPLGPAELAMADQIHAGASQSLTALLTRARVLATQPPDPGGEPLVIVLAREAAGEVLRQTCTLLDTHDCSARNAMAAAFVAAAVLRIADLETRLAATSASGLPPADHRS